MCVVCEVCGVCVCVVVDVRRSRGLRDVVRWFVVSHIIRTLNPFRGARREF